MCVATITRRESAIRQPAKVRNRVAYETRPEIFGDMSRSEFNAYVDYLERLPTCPGFLAITRILRDAEALRRLIRETLATHGPGTESVIAGFVEDFDSMSAGQELWNELIAMSVTLSHCSSFVDCNLPAGGR